MMIDCGRCRTRGAGCGKARERGRYVGTGLAGGRSWLRRVAAIAVSLVAVGGLAARC